MHQRSIGTLQWHWQQSIWIIKQQGNLEGRLLRRISFGETPYLSVFHFLFYDQILYLEPNTSFPKPNMLPGRFLGIAGTTGDAFTFYILTKSEKGRYVILTRRVVRKLLQDAPQTFAVYPDQEERVEESMIAQVDCPWVSIGAEVPRQQDNSGPGSLVSKLIEVQHDGSQLCCWKEMTWCTKKWLRDLKLVKLKRLELVIRATNEGTEEGIGDVILHMEDVSYKTLSILRKYTTIWTKIMPTRIL